ncbi:MAG: transcription antitermination factor NusB [Thermotogaceae bacterium]|nr:transcription antitermination factor NusB [Thermotogaceae bacterium]
MREAVFKAIFQMDFSGNDPEKELDNFFEKWFDEKLKEDARRYVRGIKENLKGIDRIISSKLEKWTINRLSAVDRNVLRLGTYELLNEMDIPIEVTLDEMIELAKKYGTENSGKFVNGVLDKIAKEYTPEEKRDL